MQAQCLFFLNINAYAYGQIKQTKTRSGDSTEDEDFVLSTDPDSLACIHSQIYRNYMYLQNLLPGEPSQEPVHVKCFLCLIITVGNGTSSLEGPVSTLTLAVNNTHIESGKTL